MTTATHSKQGAVQNEALYKSFKHAESSQNEWERQIAEAITSMMFKELDESRLSHLAMLTNTWSSVRDRANTAWERYHDHCTAFDYDIRH